ncbi:unnamed protein product [Merluccius merluccius]
MRKNPDTLYRHTDRSVCLQFYTKDLLAWLKRFLDHDQGNKIEFTIHSDGTIVIKTLKYRGPGSKVPGSKGPGSKGPDSEAPDSEAPDSEAPDSEGPDSEGPDSELPESLQLFRIFFAEMKRLMNEENEVSRISEQVANVALEDD